MTSMWRIYENPSEYLFQTDDSLIARKMSKRKNFILFSRGTNCNFWVYITPFKRLDHAKGALKTLLNENIVYNPTSNVYEAETTVCRTPKEESR